MLACCMAQSGGLVELVAEMLVGQKPEPAGTLLGLANSCVKVLVYRCSPSAAA
jgi:hypothetical protein